MSLKFMPHFLSGTILHSFILHILLLYYYYIILYSFILHSSYFIHSLYFSPDASVVNVSISGQLQANPHVAGPWLSPGKPTRRAVATMGSNDLVVGEDHMLGPSCQRYN